MSGRLSAFRPAKALAGAATLSLVIGFGMTSANAASADTYRQLALFGDVFEQLRKEHVSPKSDKELIEGALNGMLRSLDPHSSYLSAEAYREMTTHYSGEFGGLGIEVSMENELLKVVAPIDDTPAAKAGVLAGDIITSINGETVRGLSLEAAVKKMRGGVNTPITLTLQRAQAAKPIEITLVRDVIRVRNVKYRVENDVGYVKIATFTNRTAEDVGAAIAAIRKEIPSDRLKGYVLDLRLNPGGPLDQAINVSDAFLERGLIVSVRGRTPEDISRFSARKGDDTGGKPVIVLINGGSASAAEIVAGALQDHRRATVIGTRSFGKGSVQTIFPLNEAGALRLTTALYYTPSSTSIQGKGITPDITVEQPLPDELKGLATPGESTLQGHIKGAEEDAGGSGSASYVPPDPKDDVQLNLALALLRGEKADPAFPPRADKTALIKEGPARALQ